MNPAQSLEQILALPATDSARASQLADELVRERQSTRPRGELVSSAPALADEARVVELLERVDEGARADVLDLVGELGGSRTARVLADRLTGESATWADAGVRLRGIRALRNIGGETAVEALTTLVVRPQGKDRVRGLDALESLASAASSAVGEGGILPTSETAVGLWERKGRSLIWDPLCANISLLEQLETMELGFAPRVRAVRSAMLTALEPRLRTLLAETARPHALPRFAHVELTSSWRPSGAFVGLVDSGRVVVDPVPDQAGGLASFLAEVGTIGPLSLERILHEARLDLFYGAQKVATAIVDPDEEEDIFSSGELPTEALFA